MSVTAFDELLDDARLWIFGAESALTREQIGRLREYLTAFMDRWTSHKQEVTPAWTVVHDRFVLVGVDERRTGLSGCSIDSLVHSMAGFEQETGLRLTATNQNVFFRDAVGDIRCVSRPAFKELAAQARVNEATIVFNNMIATVGDFRKGKWEIPMKESWHIKAFGPVLA